jgi:hypothetical protein
MAKSNVQSDARITLAIVIVIAMLMHSANAAPIDGHMLYPRLGCGTAGFTTCGTDPHGIMSARIEI